MSKKYKLLKDLPNVKSGELFLLDGKGDLCTINSEVNECYLNWEIKKFDILNPTKGWFEEMKDNGYWYLEDDGVLSHVEQPDDIKTANRKEIGNYFETEKEAMKAVKKLKAWKRLKNNGFKFQFWSSSYSGDNISFFIDWINVDSKKEIEEDLELLFGDEK